MFGSALILIPPRRFNSACKAPDDDDEEEGFGAPSGLFLLLGTASATNANKSRASPAELPNTRIFVVFFTCGCVQEENWCYVMLKRQGQGAFGMVFLIPENERVLIPLLENK